MQLLFISALFGAFPIYELYAQNSLPDSSSGYAINKNIQLYTAARGNLLNLYNGIEYIFPHLNATGSPFFLSNTFQENAIVYDGALYQNVPLLYDLVNKQVVTKTPDNFYIQLIPEKINSFTLNNHLFVHLTSADVKNTALEPGFYDVTINNAATVLIRRDKIIIHASRPDEPDRYAEYNYYFLKAGDTYYAIKNSNSLLTVLHDKSSDIKAFMRQHRLNFKNNPENTLLKTVDYYAQLKK